MPPTTLELTKDDFDLDKSTTATSPAINIQSADRFPASPWNEYDTDWKFNADEPSNQYTPSYGSFNSYGSHSPSWANREMGWQEDNDHIMDDYSSRRNSIANLQQTEDYNPTSYDNDIVVGEMDVPSVSLTPAIDTFPSSGQHSPVYSGAGSPSSPGSEAGRSRASSGSSVHRPYPFDNTLMGGQKPPSPPALVIPEDNQQGLGLSASHNQNSGGLGVSINIVPSTPVGGLENQANPGHNTNEAFNNQAPTQNSNEPQGWAGSHPPTPQFSGGHTHSRSGSGSISAHASPRLTAGPINIDYAPPQANYIHRSPALSASSSLHNSPMPGYQNLAPSPAESPRPPSEEYLLPDSNPNPQGAHRPRASSAGHHPSPSGLNLGSLTLNPNDIHRPFATSASTPSHYDGNLHPSTATIGSFLTPGQRSISDRGQTHRRGVKSEDLRGTSFGLGGMGPIDPALNNNNGNNDYNLFPSGQTSEYLSPPSRSPRPVQHMRTASLGTSPSPSGSPSFPHSSHNYTHHSARSSPYPSPRASPARPAAHLPDVGPNAQGPSGGSSLGLFDTYGSGGMPGMPDQLNAMGLAGMGGMAGMHGGPMGHPMGTIPGVGPFSTSNPPKRLVTTKATHDASVSRRKNEAGYKCPIEGCGSTFTRSFNLKGHLRSHMEERPFKCKWPGCTKGFARQHDCKRHEALHLNVRPYTCAGCKKTFARMDALNRHLKSEGGAECAGVPQEYDLSGNNNGAGMGPSANGNGGRNPDRGPNGGSGPPSADMDGGGGLIM